ncbi:copper chaperone PCu(A)C [Qipengyuania sp. JC766]|uniref:copper chaperone PCu(A)C n=1 Tax=Qipengyuania sp. JC766 TaxID=3232139 RepID=UPI00345851FE
MTTPWKLALALGLAGITASCGSPESEEKEAPVFTKVPAETQVQNARLILPAVSGNPAAVYFDMTYVGDDVSLDGASVEGAERTELHEHAMVDGMARMQEMDPLPLTGGNAYNFEPGGNHLMVFGVGDDLQAGGTARVTLTAGDATVAQFDAEIRGAGEAR